MGRKKHEEHENHERWIIPYADMVTLLFAFFVVLYAMSQADVEKVKIVSESVSDAFIGHKKGGDKSKQMDILGVRGSPPTSRRFVMKKNLTNEEIIDEILESLEVEGFDVLYQEEASPIQMKIDERGVVISISAGYLFAQNSTEIPAELYPVIQVITDIIKDAGKFVLVEGHTDNLPVAGTKFFDNWDLSALRATAMAKLMIEEFGVNAKLITASGYAEFKPVASNDTEKGRTQNRRVDLVMLNASRAEDLLEDAQVPGVENLQ